MLTQPTFYHKYKNLLINVFSKNHPFTCRELSELKQVVNWDLVSANTNINWDSCLLELFSEQLNWEKLSDNLSVKWSEEMLDRFSDKIYWQSFYLNYNYPLSAELIRKYKHKLQVETLLLNEYISIPTDVFEEMIGLDLACVEEFSQAVNVNFTEKLIEKYANLWDWEILSSNPAVPFTDNLIKKFYHKWDFESMGRNRGLYDRLDFMEKYTPVDYEWLSRKKETGWTNEFIEQYKDKLDWQLLSCNKHLPWSEEFFKRYFERWNFYLLSSNENLPWTEELVEAYEDMWNWSDTGPDSYFGSLSKNSGLPWSYDFIKKYAHLWTWGFYWENASFRYTDYGMSQFISKEWSPEQLLEFEEYYDWEFMVDNNPDLYSILFQEIAESERIAFIRYIA
jgi:hypothetical protein